MQRFNDYVSFFATPFLVVRMPAAPDSAPLACETIEFQPELGIVGFPQGSFQHFHRNPASLRGVVCFGVSIDPLTASTGCMGRRRSGGRRNGAGSVGQSSAPRDGACETSFGRVLARPLRTSLLGRTRPAATGRPMPPPSLGRCCACWPATWHRCPGAWLCRWACWRSRRSQRSGTWPDLRTWRAR